jgi:hypothetical protein
MLACRLHGFPDRHVKSALIGKEKEILGIWGREYESLEQVVLADYGIGIEHQP